MRRTRAGGVKLPGERGRPGWEQNSRVGPSPRWKPTVPRRPGAVCCEIAERVEPSGRSPGKRTPHTEGIHEGRITTKESGIGDNSLSSRSQPSNWSNPRSACRVEQTCKSFSAYFLPGGCENLWAGSGGSGSPSRTAGDDGAERAET
jgi:hypothetical protein